MSKIRETATLTAVMVSGSIGLLALENNQASAKLNRIQSCYQLAKPLVQSCVSEVDTNYAAQDLALGVLEGATLLGAVASGALMINGLRRRD